MARLGYYWSAWGQQRKTKILTHTRARHLLFINSYISGSGCLIKYIHPKNYAHGLRIVAFVAVASNCSSVIKANLTNNGFHIIIHVSLQELSNLASDCMVDSTAYGQTKTRSRNPCCYIYVYICIYIYIHIYLYYTYIYITRYVIKWQHFPRYWPFVCREFTGHRWIPRTKTSDAKLWCFLWFATE